MSLLANGTSDGKADHTRPSVIILSTADFDADVWTNKQHLAVGLSQYTDVTYVGSIGLRRPRLTKKDMRRVARRLLSFWSVLTRRRAARNARSKQEGGQNSERNVKVIRPLILPFHGISAIDLVNRFLIKRQLSTVLSDNRPILWTFSPETLGLESHVRAVVYHSVDLLHQIPGVPHDYLLSRERQTLDIAQTVVASSTGVAEHLKASGRHDVKLWTNVARTDLFRCRGEQRRSSVIFAGHLTSEKVRLDLLWGLVRAGIELKLAGPLAIDGSKSASAFEELIRDPRVRYLGNLALAELAREVRLAKIGLIPYGVNQYTKGVFPMKVFEYLSAGLYVVATDLPSLRDQRLEGVSLAEEEEAFTLCVRHALVTFREDEADSRSRFAEPYSWESRLAQALAEIKSLV